MRSARRALSPKGRLMMAVYASSAVRMGRINHGRTKLSSRPSPHRAEISSVRPQPVQPAPCSGLHGTSGGQSTWFAVPPASFRLRRGGSRSCPHQHHIDIDRCTRGHAKIEAPQPRRDGSSLLDLSNRSPSGLSRTGRVAPRRRTAGANSGSGTQPRHLTTVSRSPAPGSIPRRRAGTR